MKLIIAYLIFLFLWLWMLTMVGCNPVKQATKHYDKAKDKSIVTVANLARTDFPCVTVKADTIRGKDSVILRDTTIYQQVMADCPDTAQNAPKGSTMKVPVTAACHCKDSIIYRPKYIINTVEDSAKIFVAQAAEKKALKDVDKYHSRSKIKGWIIAVLVGLFALYLIITRVFKLF